MKMIWVHLQYEDMNFPLMTSIFCPSLLQASSGAVSTFNSNSSSVSYLLTLQVKSSNFFKIFEKIFRFFSFICWPWWCQLVWPSSLCVIIYLLSVSLWAFKREVWGCCSSSTHLHHHFILVALGSSDRRESERKTGRNWKKRRSWR